MGILYLLMSLSVMGIISPCLSTYSISDYRLITKDRPNAGIVELYNQGLGWGRVCMYTFTWSFDHASIVCHHLNFPGTSRAINAEDFEEEGDGWLSSVTNNASTYYWGCSVDEHKDMQCDTYSEYDCARDNIGAVTCKEPGYLGCYSDPYSFTQERDRVFHNGTDHKGELTIHLCITVCKENGFFYAGVEYKYQCFCGRQDEVYDRHGNLSDGECNYVCAGDSLESCGGSNKIAIYQVDLGVCNDPGIPAHGSTFGNSLRYGSKVSFECSDGHILEGADVIQCVKNVSIANNQHTVMWDDDFPNCTGFTTTISSTMSTFPTVGGAPTNPMTFLGTSDPGKQRGHQVIYISAGIAPGLIVTIVIIVAVVIRRRHKSPKEHLHPVTDYTPASRNHDSGGVSPLRSRADGEADLFVLSELTSHSNHAGENNYVDEEQPPSQSELSDRPGIARDAFGYESVCLPSGESALNGSGGTRSDDPVGGTTDLYANTEFHEVPDNLIDNELYG